MSSYAVQKQLADDLIRLLESLHTDLEVKREGYREAVEFMDAKGMVQEIIAPLKTNMFPRISNRIDELQTILGSSRSQAILMKNHIEDAERAAQKFEQDI